MFLAEAVQVADGKLNILGAGWSQINAGPSPMAIAVMIEFEVKEANGEHHFELFLTDGEHQPVFTDSPDGSMPVEVRGDATVALPEGYDNSLAVPWPIAVNIPGLALEPDRIYRWNLVVDGHTEPDWVLAFRTVAPPTG
jgi:hypothetical protein